MRRTHIKRSSPRRTGRAHVFTVVVEQDEDGLFVASCPALQGCYTQAKTYEGVMKNIRDAIQLSLDMRAESGEPLPQDLGAEKVVVMAAA
jgi:predicted RNase H-like HicB family nuclease